jgi:hypothetical protein
MYMSPEYLREQEGVIQLCTLYAQGGGSPERYDVVASFCRNFRQILSVGCGGWDPVRFKATHALDVHPVAERMLRKNGWGGAFFLGDCRDLPWPDKAFECGTLVEVVEHLPTCHDIILSVKELDRVCRNWILTTPLFGMHVPSHKRHLTDEDLDFLCRKTGATWKKYSRWYFMWKGAKAPEFREGVGYEGHPGVVDRYHVRPS